MIIKILAASIFFSGILILSYSFNRVKTKNEDPKALFDVYCGRCHLAPDPRDLPKETWKDHVLPAMAARLGIAYPNYNAEDGLKPAEIDTLTKYNYFPKEPAISQNDWNSVVNYILKKAPETRLKPINSIAAGCIATGN